MTNISPAVQRSLALALFGALLLSMINFFALPMWQAARNYDVARSNLEALLRSKREIVERIPILEAKLGAIRANKRFSQSVFQDPTVGAAGASLQTQVRELLVQAGVEIVSSEVLPSTTDQTLIRFGSRVVLRCDEEALRQILLGVEHSERLLDVERLQLSTNAVGRAGEQTRHLTATLEIFGFWKAPR